jgi:hypothetical protein
VVGVDRCRDRARRGFGRGVAHALHGTLQLRLGEPPGADLPRYHHLCRGGCGGVSRTDPSVADSGTSPAVDTAADNADGLSASRNPSPRRATRGRSTRGRAGTLAS